MIASEPTPDASQLRHSTSSVEHPDSPPPYPKLKGLASADQKAARRAYEKVMYQYMIERGTPSTEVCGPCKRTGTPCIRHPIMRKCAACFRGHDVCEVWDDSVKSAGRRRIQPTFLRASMEDMFEDFQPTVDSSETSIKRKISDWDTAMEHAPKKCGLKVYPTKTTQSKRSAKAIAHDERVRKIHDEGALQMDPCTRCFKAYKQCIKLGNRNTCSTCLQARKKCEGSNKLGRWVPSDGEKVWEVNMDEDARKYRRNVNLRSKMLCPTSIKSELESTFDSKSTVDCAEDVADVKFEKDSGNSTD